MSSGASCEVAVHHDRPVAARLGEAGGDRGVLTEVAAQAEDPQVRIVAREAPQHRPAVVDAAIVDEHELVAVGHLREAPGEPLVERDEAVGAPVHGHDDAQLDAVYRCASRVPAVMSRLIFADSARNRA